jgi:CRISPR-associated endonuclease/helicase Cas3
MQLLVDHYHVTFVISTATQPAFGERNIVDRRFPGLKGIREIMGENVPQLYDSLRRVRVNFHKDLRSVSDLDEIAVELGKYKQVLCVVSDRKSCRELYKLMPEGTYHLSALMCGEHRSKKIEEIKAKLKNNEKVRVISTQLVEAGVDFDFPVVYRSMAGLDSIAQAAGRCNREGKLSGLGSVVVFNAPKRSPPGILRKGEETARNIINNEKRDMLDFGMFTIYFSELYWKSNSLDSKKIISLLSPSRSDLGISFRTASEKFQIIDDSVRKTILVRYGDGIKLIDIVKSKGADRFMMRKLQRFTVSIYDRDFEHMLVRGSIEEIQPGIFALTSSLEYRDDIGLIVDEVLYDPEEFIQ